MVSIKALEWSIIVIHIYEMLMLINGNSVYLLVFLWTQQVHKLDKFKQVSAMYTYRQSELKTKYHPPFSACSDKVNVLPYIGKWYKGTSNILTKSLTPLYRQK